MSKKNKYLTNEDKIDIVNTLKMQFKVMSIDEKKAVLKKLDISKTDIEKLDEHGMLNILISTYDPILDAIDLNNVNIDTKYITANEYISGDRKTELKTEIENYKKL
jgi:DNA-directed RNA polymerase subunit H (RpoH/RPB5)